MKLLINLNGTNVVLSVPQFAALAEIIETGEVLENKYMGTGLGTNGTNYMDVLAPVKLQDVLRPGVMTDTSYEALAFVTKQLADAAKK
jgi:hypothetical protein